MKKESNLVIGGNGFVGKVLVKKLRERKQDVKILDKERDDIQDQKNFLHKNILNLSEVDLPFFQNVKTVYYLAAYQYHSPLPRFGKYKVFYQNNVVGLKKVIDLCVKAGVRKIIYVSSDMVYGIPQAVPIQEDHPTHPIGGYGKTKREAERMIQAGSIPYIILRPRLIIGAGRLGVFEKLFVLIHKGLPVFLIGNGKNRYQMISVYDCAEACILAALKDKKNRVYNLGSDHSPSVYNLIQEIMEEVHSSSRIIKLNAFLVKVLLRTLTILYIPLLEREQYEIADQDYVLDTSRIKKELGWKPVYEDKMMLLEAYKSYHDRNV